MGDEVEEPLKGFEIFVLHSGAKRWIIERERREALDHRKRAACRACCGVHKNKVCPTSRSVSAVEMLQNDLVNKTLLVPFKVGGLFWH
jgi:hypothetical protein